MKKRKSPSVVPSPFVEKPSASIRLGKNIKLPALKVGKKITVELTGKITNISDDEYSRGFAMNITSVETEDEGSMGDDLDEMRSKRRY